MDRINRWLNKYLLISIPLHVLLLVGGFVPALKGIKAVSIAGDILGFNFIAWLFVLVFMLAQLLVSDRLRDGFFSGFSKLAGVKERDERESLAIDKAGRYAYISTLCLLVVMLLFYSINFSVGNLPPDKVVDGKHKYITIGFGVALTDDKAAAKPEDALRIFSNWDLPLSKWSLLFLVIAWHILSFLFYLRRENKFQE